MYKIGKIIAFVIYLIVHSVAFSYGSVYVEASVDQYTTQVSNPIHLTFEIKGTQESVNPIFPKLQNFSVSRNGTSKNISIINGRTNASIICNYTLIPLKKGDYTIPPIQVKINGKQFSSKPIKIKILENTGRISGDAYSNNSNQASLFVKTKSSQKQAYVGQEIILDIVTYTNKKLLSIPEYKFPKFTGFITKKFENLYESQEEVDGVIYKIIIMRISLFPIKEGRYTISPVSVYVLLPDRTRRRGGDIFSSLFGSSLRGKRYILNTNKVDFNIIPFPGEQPEDFVGAVGEFQVQAELSTKKIVTDNPFSIKISVKGQGNLNLIGDINVRKLENFHQYDLVHSVKLDASKTFTTGVKTYSLLLVPKKSGDFVVDGLSFSYFSLRSNKFISVDLPSIRVSVEKNPNQASQNISSKQAQADIQAFNSNRVPNNATTPLMSLKEEQHIRHITNMNLKSYSELWKNRFFQYLLLFPVFLLILVRLRKYIRRLYFLFIPSPSMKIIQDIRKIQIASASPEVFNLLLVECLKNFKKYFSVYLSYHPRYTMTVFELEKSLKSKIKNKEDVDLALKLWRELDFFIFSSNTIARDKFLNIFSDVIALLESLEKKKKKHSFILKSSIFYICLFSLFGIVQVFATSVSDIENQFMKANQLYEDAQFTESIDIYKPLVPLLENFSIHYNLGNAYYKTGQIGYALGHWIQAWRIQPYNDLVRDNIMILQQQYDVLNFFSNVPVRKILERLFYSLSLNQLAALSMILWWILVCFFVCSSIRSKNTILRKFSIIILFKFVLCCSWFSTYYIIQNKKYGVVTSEEVFVYSGPSRNFEVGFSVPEGLRITVLAIKKDWVHVYIQETGLRGWIMNSDLFLIK